MPEAGRVVPEYGINNMRERIFRQYRIIYKIESETILIITITHSTRMFKDYV